MSAAAESDTRMAARRPTAAAPPRARLGTTPTLVAAATAIVLLAAGAPARAQSSQARAAMPRPPVPAGQRPAPAPATASANANDQAAPATREQLRNEIADRMRELRAQRIAEALALDPSGAARLMPVLTRYDEREMSLARERRSIVREIRAELQSGRADDNRLSAAIGRLLVNRASRRTVDDERIAELRKLLTPVQQARLVLALPRIEREFSERLRELTRGRRQADADDAFSP